MIAPTRKVDGHYVCDVSIDPRDGTVTEHILAGPFTEQQADITAREMALERGAEAREHERITRRAIDQRKHKPASNGQKEQLMRLCHRGHK